jgi:hypothetical protein
MKNNYTLGLVLACCMAVLACSKNEPQAPNTEGTPSSLHTSSTEPAPTPYREGDLILGKKLNNPYTLANMKSAISRLEGQGLSLLKAVNLRASHYYVKFKPADSAQYEQLQTDKRMTVYPSRSIMKLPYEEIDTTILAFLRAPLPTTMRP